MEEVEPRRATAGMQELEQRGRPAGTLEVRTHDSMARIVPNNPFAFPPSMAVRWRR